MNPNLNLILNECETLRDVRIYKHGHRAAWVVAAIDPMTASGAIVTIDDGGANVEPPNQGSKELARALAAGGERRYVLPLLPAGVALKAMGMARENRFNATHKIEVWQWLREVLPPSPHGARMGFGLSEPWPGVPVRVHAMPLDRGGYTPDGTYYGLRQRGQRLYVLHQQQPNRTRRQLVATLDADCRATALAKAKAWADERGLMVYRLSGNT